MVFPQQTLARRLSTGTMSRRMRRLALVVAAAIAVAAMPVYAASPAAHFTLAQVLGYPFPTALTRAASSGDIAWVLNIRGTRNIWVASAPDFTPRQVTHYQGDDGQELTGVTLSPHGTYVVYARGGDHDRIYPLRAPPNPLARLKGETMQVWRVATAGGTPQLIGAGDAPAVSADGKQVSFMHEGAIWIAPLDGHSAPHRLFHDDGTDHDMHWSPDGTRLAFVSSRGEHSFIGIYTAGQSRLRFVAPSTSRDTHPRWSPDGRSIAFVRRPGDAGPLAPLLKRTPRPWAIWVADAATGAAHAVWKSPHTLEGSMPDNAGGSNLHWAAGARLIFVSDVDGWPHLYSVPARGGRPRRLTAGAYMVEDVAMSPRRRFVIYSANAGKRAGDIDRRHLFRVAVDGGPPQALTPGQRLEWSPTPLHDGHTLAFIRGGARTPPLVTVKSLDTGTTRPLGRARIPADFPRQALVVPRYVSFKAGDGHMAYGQLFVPSAGGHGRPAVIFVHGGPMRQMLLGWHHSGYYANAYAVNQYLANHGYVVLSINYRLGIGHGWQFHHPANAGPAGASEYRDVLAGARYLQHLAQVDGSRIGIWGGSYGGYLTALALARNSDIFKAGSDWAGIHDWALDMYRNWFKRDYPPFERGDREAALKEAWRSSPVAAIDHWRSPVLLIQGDDDHTVRFQQTVDMANRLAAHHVPFEELVIANDIHSFLRYRSWYRADARTVEFLDKHLAAASAP